MKYNHDATDTFDIINLTRQEASLLRNELCKKIFDYRLENKSLSYLMEEVENKILKGDIKLLRYILSIWLYQETLELSKRQKNISNELKEVLAKLKKVH